MDAIIRAIEQQQIKSDLPEFHVGDNVSRFTTASPRVTVSVSRCSRAT